MKIHIFVIWALVMVPFSAAFGETLQPKLELITQVESQDLVAYSPDATKVAIIHTKSFPEHPPQAFHWLCIKSIPRCNPLN